MVKELEDLSTEVWGGLLPELWGEIGKRLESQVDIQAFRSTCKLWRCLVPPPFPCIFPLKIPPPPHMSTSTKIIHCIAERTVYLIGSSQDDDDDPILLVLESKPEGDRQVFFPFRLFRPGESLFRLGRRDSFVWSGGRGQLKPPKVLDLKGLRVSLVYKSYYHFLYRHDALPKMGIGETNWFLKIELFSYYANTNIPSQSSTRTGVDLAIVALLPQGELAQLRLNNYNNNNYNNTLSMGWRLVRQSINYDDIIKFSGKLWGVDIYGGAFVMDDFDSLNMTQVVASPIIDKSYRWGDNNCPCKGRKRFVEALGELFLLFPCRLRRGYEEKQIKVFRLSKSGKSGSYSYDYEWLEVESIGNKAFFVGPGFSFSMIVGPKSLWPNNKGNCIFLNGLAFCRSNPTKNDFPLFKNMLNPCPTAGVYCLVDKKFTTFSTSDCPTISCTIFPSFLFSPKKIKGLMRPRGRQGMMHRR
ncbi:hypothetical protein RND81_02G129700 [Saponaria officinalis]|uniref:KIB1-4 beta-propeller domain-containing protein n=1 Tax=Saponaria officinalis TaxID=3572 RepID=A0AAW1ML90_SAPOF